MHAQGCEGSGDRGAAPSIAQAIARQAAVLFAERGYDATPVRAIAEASGVTCPTLYYHFGNKQGIAQALLLRPLENLRAQIQALLHTPLDPVVRLRLNVEKRFQFIREDPDRGRFLLAVMFGPLGRELSAEVTEALGRIHAADLAVIDRLVEAHLVPPDVTHDLALCLKGQIVIRSVEFLYHARPLDVDLACRIVHQILHGYAQSHSDSDASKPHGPPPCTP